MVAEYRLPNPVFFGFYPEGFCVVLVRLSDMLLFAGFCSAKLLSLGCLIAAAPVARARTGQSCAF
jgi:hypothetical protein